MTAIILQIFNSKTIVSWCNAKNAASAVRGGSQPTYSFGDDVGMSMVSQYQAVGVSCPCHHQLL